MSVKNQEVKKSEQLAQAIVEAKTKEAALTVQRDAGTATLARMQADYESAVKTGVAEAKLDELDASRYKAERELERTEIKLKQATEEIAALEQDKAAAIAVEREMRFLKIFDDLCEDFILFEMALTEFQSHKAKIEAGIRDFMNEASQSGRDIHRLRLTDNIRRQLIERLWPGYNSKQGDTFTKPLADILEDHCRAVLGIPRVNGKVSSEVVKAEESISTQEGSPL